MWKDEAVWINREIIALGLDKRPTRTLNLGSSTRTYREIYKPYINELLVAPLTLYGSITNVDTKAEEGVDEVGDFCDKAFIEHLTKKQYDLILCNNLLTHVTCLDAVFEVIEKCLAPDGYAIISAPSLYPYCADPYDAKYRPSVSDITRKLPNLKIISSSTIKFGDTHARQMLRTPRLAIGFGLNVLLPIRGLNRWLSVVSDLPNVFKPFQTNCVIMQNR